MKLDGKLKGGLAWAGLVVILAVPAADIALGPRDSARTVTAVPAETATVEKPKLDAPAKATTDPVQTASTGADPVTTYLDKNKKLPSYVSDGGTGATDTASLSGGDMATQAGPAPKASDGAASPAIAAVPPVPLPRSARPAAAPQTDLASLPAPAKPAAATQPQLVLTEKEEARARSVAPFPLSDGDVPRDTASVEDEPVVRGDELEEWDSGSLAQYLERKGLLDRGSNASAEEVSASEDYDPDGFFLDQGPNAGEPKRKRLDELWFF